MADEFFIFPLSFAQERLWFMEHVMPNTALFNLHVAHRLTIPPVVEVLERSLNEIVHRHESLRTTVRIVDGQPAQVISPTMMLDLQVVDLCHLPPDLRNSALVDLATKEARKPFSLDTGPLLRPMLVRTGTGEYVFLLTMHHIISDGWSMGIFWTEFAQLWKAFAAGQPSPLADLPIQYADFAVWQREWLNGGVLNAQLDYWRRQLADMPVFEIPGDRPRPAVQTFSGSEHEIVLSKTLTSQLKVLSQREGTTLFMTLLAAFQVLLHRYTGQIDIAVGSYIAGRNRSEVEAVIGFFLNTIVLRTDLGGNPSFREVLRRTRSVTVDAYAHQDVPFAKLVQELQPDRDLSRNPFFQVVFQLLNIPNLTQPSGAAKLQSIDIQRGTSTFDLTCTLWEGANEITGHFEYNTELFHSDTVARMVEHYRTLLESVVSDPGKRISDLSILKPADSELLTAWNNTSHEVDYTTSLVELFEMQAARCMEQSAFFCEGHSITFAELNRRSNQLAAYLREHGIQAEKVVGLGLLRGIDYVVGLIAILKAGGAFMPLDLTHPPDRLRVMIVQSEASIVITSPEYASMFARTGAEVVCIHSRSTDLTSYSSRNHVVSTSPDQLCYVIYTSGSTGVPKAVAAEHRQVLNRLQWMWKEYPFQDHEVGCSRSAVGFVDSIWELLGPLLQGFPTVILSAEAVKDVHLLVRTLRKHKVTRLWVVPSFLRTLLDACEDLRQMLPDLNFWVSSGETLTAELLKRFQSQMPGSVLYNLYGTSEVWDATWHDTRDWSADHPVPIGRPIWNVQTYVLDSHLAPVPIGVPGQLFVGGVGLARGYIDKPSGTSPRFMINPLAGNVNARIYATGDVVRHRSDGTLEFIGRMDRQLKVRGYRIELDEIEASLSSHPNVAHGVVVVMQHTSGEEQLTAYVVPRHGMTLDGLQVRRFLQGLLPGFMVPAFIEVVNSLPLTTSGKVAADKLPAVKRKRESGSNTGFVVNPVESSIAAIWRNVLRLEEVGSDDNFFDLGGHSLLLVQVHSRVLQELGLQITITDLFRYPTIRSLATYVAEKGMYNTDPGGEQFQGGGRRQRSRNR